MKGGQVRAGRRRTAVLLTSLAALLTLRVSLGAPLRAQGGDTVPGRLHMVTLACSGSSDLSSVQWLARRVLRGELPYYARLTHDGRGLVSTFGPGPGFMGLPFFLDVPPGAVVDDALLASRSRLSAATWVALAALIVGLGLSCVVPSGWAALVAATLGLSYVGAATMAQGLWQQTAMLPFLALAASAGIAARFRPWCALLAVGAAAAVAWLRPAEAPLAFGLCAFALLRVPGRARSPHLWAGVLASAMGLSLVLGTWNVWYLGGWLPSGQWLANQRATTNVFVLRPLHLVTALTGLTVSPGRGILWFAPLLPVGLALTWWSKRRVSGRTALLLGVAAQTLLVCAFYKWWGGLGYGPRLLAGCVWVGAIVPWLGGVPSRAWVRGALVACMIWTCAVGVLGVYRYDPRHVEIPLDPDHHPERLFSWRAGLWRQLAGSAGAHLKLRDAPAGPFVYCDPVGLRAP